MTSTINSLAKPDFLISIPEKEPHVDLSKEACRSDSPALSDTSKKALKIVFHVLTAMGCVFLINRTCSAFSGYGRWTPFTLAILASLGLKHITFLNETPDNQKISNTNRVLNWLKKIPSDFITGVSKAPGSLILGTIIAASTYLTYQEQPNKDYINRIDQMTLSEIAVKGPFLEELSFRECLQGSLISIMKLTNLVGLRMGKDITISEANINTAARVVSAASFGIAHSSQSIIQAVASGISSYFYQTWLYEKNGLFASFGLHLVHNFVVFYLRAAPSSAR